MGRDTGVIRSEVLAAAAAFSDGVDGAAVGEEGDLPCLGGGGDGEDGDDGGELHFEEVVGGWRG